MEIRLMTTTAHGAPLEQTLPLMPDALGVENQVVNLYPGVTGQTLEGFGGAVTDAAAYVYAQMPAEKRRQLMRDYFSEEGLGYRIVRVPMDSCDFSVEMYEALSDPADTALAGFSTQRQFRYILPMLEDAREAAGGNLELMLSPWSPPAFMKDNGERKHGGRLLPQYADMWAGPCRPGIPACTPPGRSGRSSWSISAPPWRRRAWRTSRSSAGITTRSGLMSGPGRWRARWTASPATGTAAITSRPWI